MSGLLYSENTLYSYLVNPTCHSYSDLKHNLILCLLTGAAVLLDDVDLLLLRVLVAQPQLEPPGRAPEVPLLHHGGLEDDTAGTRGRSRPEDLDLLLVQSGAGLHHSVDTVVREPNSQVE